MGGRRDQGVEFAANLISVKQFAGRVIGLQWCPAILKKEFLLSNFGGIDDFFNELLNDCTRRSAAPFVAR